MSWFKNKIDAISKAAEKQNEKELSNLKAVSNAKKTETKSATVTESKLKTEVQTPKKAESYKKTAKTRGPEYSRNRFLFFMKQIKTGLNTWASGLIKEFSRVTWLKGKKLWISYAIVIQIIIIAALILYGISRLAGLIA